MPCSRHKKAPTSAVLIENWTIDEYLRKSLRLAVPRLVLGENRCSLSSRQSFLVECYVASDGVLGFISNLQPYVRLIQKITIFYEMFHMKCAVLAVSFASVLTVKIDFKHHDQAELEEVLIHVAEECPNITRVYQLENPSVLGTPLWVIEFSKNPGLHELCKDAPSLVQQGFCKVLWVRTCAKIWTRLFSQNGCLY